MQSLYILPPHASTQTEASYENLWRWHDAERITRPLDNHPAASTTQHNTETNSARLQKQKGRE